MFDNLIVVAIIVIVLWLGAMGYYFYVSRQQSELKEEIDKLREELDSTDEEG
jgi:preprotein translocase subunit YajC